MGTEFLYRSYNCMLCMCLTSIKTFPNLIFDDLEKRLIYPNVMTNLNDSQGTLNINQTMVPWHHMALKCFQE